MKSMSAFSVSVAGFETIMNNKYIWGINIDPYTQ
jgi:hypothetical protein